MAAPDWRRRLAVVFVVVLALSALLLAVDTRLATGWRHERVSTEQGLRSTRHDRLLCVIHGSDARGTRAAGARLAEELREFAAADKLAVVSVPDEDPVQDWARWHRRFARLSRAHRYDAVLILHTADVFLDVDGLLELVAHTDDVLDGLIAWVPHRAPSGPAGVLLSRTAARVLQDWDDVEEPGGGEQPVVPSVNVTTHSWEHDYSAVLTALGVPPRLQSVLLPVPAPWLSADGTCGEHVLVYLRAQVKGSVEALAACAQQCLCGTPDVPGSGNSTAQQGGG